MKLNNNINKKDSALASELKVFQSTERFILLVLPIVKRFENFYRYTLGETIANESTELLQLITMANMSENYEEKSNLILTFRSKFESIKALIRVCEELKLLNAKYMINIADLAESLGKQSTAWHKKIKSKIKEKKETVVEAEIKVENNIGESPFDENFPPITIPPKQEEEKPKEEEDYDMMFPPLKIEVKEPKQELDLDKFPPLKLK